MSGVVMRCFLLTLVSLVALTVGLASPVTAVPAAGPDSTGGQGGCGAKWVSIYGDEPGVNVDQGGQLGVNGMAVSPSGDRVYITGHEYETGGSGYSEYGVTVATAASGERQWVARLRSALFWDVAVSPDGQRVFVTGRIVAEGNQYGDLVTVAYDSANGDELWQNVLEPPPGRDQPDSGGGIAVSSDGTRVYVAGYFFAHEGGWAEDTVAVGYDAVTGERQWVSVREDPLTGERVGLVDVSPDGRTVYVSGTSGRNSGSDGTEQSAVTIAYVARDPENPEREGRERWVARWAAPPGSLPPGRADKGQAWGQVLSPDSARLYVTLATGIGAMTSSARRYDWVTVAYDTATGEKLWASRYRGLFEGQGEPGENRPQAIVVSPGGERVFVTGYSPSRPDNGNFDLATVAYDAATGKELWVDRFGSPLYAVEAASDAAVSPDGTTLYVTGNDHPFVVPFVTGRRQTTIAYDTASGARRTVVGFNFPSYDNTSYDNTSYDRYTRSRVEVSADGEMVFVAGGFRNTARGVARGVGTGDYTGDYGDWFTAAYDVSVTPSPLVPAAGVTEVDEAVVETTGCG